MTADDLRTLDVYEVRTPTGETRYVVAYWHHRALEWRTVGDGYLSRSLDAFAETAQSAGS